MVSLPEPSEPCTDEPSESCTDEPSEPCTDEPSEPCTDESSEPCIDEPAEGVLVTELLILLLECPPLDPMYPLPLTTSLTHHL